MESATPPRELFLAGSGTLAVEIAEWASDAGWVIAGLVELMDPARAGTRVGGHLVVAADALPAGARAVVAAGGSRRAHWSAVGCEPATVVHPTAHVGASATLGGGCVIGPGVVIGAGTEIGPHTLVSRGALVGHHTRIGAFASLLPGANVAGNVTLGDDTTVAMGAVVVDHTRIGAGATIAAGAVVLRDVPDRTRVQANAELRAMLEQRVEPVLHAVAADEAGNRRRLYAARAAPDYGAPFEDRDALVSITLATHDRPDLLLRSLRSVLAQTHERIEVLVVGDAAGPEVADVVAGLGDPRVHFHNLTQRITAHPDRERHWLVASTMARNEATRRSRGAWLLHFDDDDTLRPDAVASLLALARESRAEVAYGGFDRHEPDGTSTAVIAFPPAEGRFGWQGALIHRELRFFERELVAAHLGVPGDTFLLRRMLRSGVRFALLERVVWDYFPSRLWPYRDVR